MMTWWSTRMLPTTRLFSSEIQLEYIFVERREYSRTSVAAASFYDDDNNRKKSSSAPLFIIRDGRDNCGPMTSPTCPGSSSAYSQIETITRPDISSETGREIVAEDVEILWDAGELLEQKKSR